MGLLSIWDDWKKETGYFQDSSSNLETIARNSDTINRNRKKGVVKSSDPLDPRNYGYNGPIKSRINANEGVTANQIQTKKIVPSDPITQGGVGVKQADDLSFMQRLSNMAGVNFDDAAAMWKDKGGFEGLMSNPAFTMGLAFMQAGAEGKTLGQGALDNVMKAAGISSHYKKIIADRKMEPIQATSGDISEVKDMLKSINIEEGNWFENLLSGPGAGARYEAAVEEIALEFQKEIREKQAQLKREGKSQVIKRTDQLKILQRLVKSGKIQKKESFLSKIGITSSTLQMPVPMAEGGPIEAGKPYVVGEEGPEIIIPHSSGNVLSNDDSQIYAMLLAANPQLQKVSKIRAEKILRNRFPEYFE